MDKKTKIDTEKSFYLNLLKTAIKDKDFLENKEIFDDLLSKSKIDINEEFKRDQNINFLSLTLNSFEKFKYLVERHHANPHVYVMQDKYVDRHTIATELLNKFYVETTKFKEERKILNYLKNDKDTWLNKKITTYTTSSPSIEETFFEIYFNQYSNKAEELEKVLKFKFKEKEKLDTFNEAKEKLAFQLCFSTVLENAKHGYTKYGENKIDHVKNYLPILAKNNLTHLKETEVEKIVNYMVSDGYRIGFAKTEGLELLSLMIENKVVDINYLKKINFSEKFINHFIFHLEEDIKENKKNNAQIKPFDKKNDSLSPLTEYGVSVFEEFLKGLEALNKINLDSSLSPSQKEKLLSIIHDIVSDPNREQKKEYVDNKKVQFDTKKEAKHFEIIKELIQMQNGEVLSPNKKLKI